MGRVLAGGLLPALLVFAHCGRPHEEASAPAAATVRASLATAERLELPSEIEVHGTVEPEMHAAVSSRVMAMVTAVRVAPGDAVARGQVLIEIDPQTARGQLAQAEGALAQARAALTVAERNYERFRALAEANAASELELDMARMQHEQALGAVEQAEGAVAAAASVASDSRVTAPFAGRVTRKLVDVGDLAGPGRPLLSLESQGGRRLRLSVPERLMARSRLATGDRVRFAIDSRPDLGVLEGPVVEVAPGADPASHAFEAKVGLPAGVEVASGSAGRAWIPGESRTFVAVPGGAVLRQGGMTLVVVRTADGFASSRVVTVGGQLAGDRVEVLSGLAGGETVLVGLAAPPASGAPVEPSGAGS